MNQREQSRTIRHTPRAGQYAKGQANARFYRGLLLVLAGCMAGAFVGGIGATLTVQRVELTPTGLAALAVSLVLWVPAWWLVRRLMRPLDDYLHRTGRERIRWLRGAQGEALVSWLLGDLGPEWHLFENLPLADDGEDVDHVLIGPAGCRATTAARSPARPP